MALRNEDYFGAAQALGGTGAAFGEPPAEGVLAPPPVDVAVPEPEQRLLFAAGVPEAPPAQTVVTPWADPAGFAALKGPQPEVVDDPALAAQALKAGGQPVLSTTRQAPARSDFLTTPPPAEAAPEIGTTATEGQPGAPQEQGFVMGGTPPTYHAAGFDYSRVPVEDVYRKQQEAALEKIGKAHGEARLQTGILGALQEDAMAEAAEQAKVRAAQRAGREAQRQGEVQAAEDRLQTAMADAKNATMAKESFLERHPGSILMAIGATLGGVLSARTGQPNEALRMLDNAIARDIAAQKEAIARKQTAVGNEQNLIGMMRNRFGDERQADMAAEMAHRQTVQDQLARLSSKAKNVEQQHALSIMEADNEGKLADLRARYSQAAYRGAYATPGTGGIPGTGTIKEASALAKDVQDRVFRDDSGNVWEAKTAKDAARLDDASVAYRKGKALADQVNYLRSPEGIAKEGVLAPAKLKTAGAELVLFLKGSEELGALDKGLGEFAENAMGDATSPTSAYGTRVNQIVDRMGSALENRKRQVLVRRLEYGNAVTPTGQVVPVARYTGESYGAPTRTTKTVQRNPIVK